MTFEFVGTSEEDYKTLIGLIKGNQGLFKSLRQSNYLMGRFKSQRTSDTIESVKEFFGIDIRADQTLVSVDAYARWAAYGTNSLRPVTWMFLVDKYGIVAQYKLGYIGDMKSGTRPDPSKTQLQWLRTCPVKEFIEPSAIPSGEHIGTIGQRLQVTGVITKISTFHKQKFHYYDTDVGYLTTIKVGNDILIYWGVLKNQKEGNKVVLKFTVKEHTIRNGIKQTTIARPAIQMQKELEF